jgi:chromosome partitioning protein
MFDTQLSERDAYRALFAFGGVLSGLDTDQVSNIAAAILNARLFTNETVALLKTKVQASRTGS